MCNETGEQRGQDMHECQEDPTNYLTPTYQDPPTERIEGWVQLSVYMNLEASPQAKVKSTD